MTANLPEIVAGAGIASGHVTVFPLFARERQPPIEYRLGIDAMADGTIALGEIGRGSVNSIRARNISGHRVLFVDGDHLLGARQNRVVISTAVIGARQEVDLPVCCVEQGRWQPVGERFRPAPAAAPASVRSVVKSSLTSSLFDGRGRHADQSRVWATIADNIRGPAPTRALMDSFIASSDVIDQVSRRIGYVDRAAGLAMAVGRRLVSLDLFDKPSTCAVYWKRLVEGVAHDPGAAGEVGVAAVHDLVDELVTTNWSEFHGVGCGREQRARITSATASIVELDGRVVHLGVAALH